MRTLDIRSKRVPLLAIRNLLDPILAFHVRHLNGIAVIGKPLYVGSTEFKDVLAKPFSASPVEDYENDRHDGSGWSEVSSPYAM
jgi:hypothetical protein